LPEVIAGKNGKKTSCAEVRGAESRNDFIHKLGIVRRELNESLVWLRLLERSGTVTADVKRIRRREHRQICERRFDSFAGWMDSVDLLTEKVHSSDCDVSGEEGSCDACRSAEHQCRCLLLSEELRSSGIQIKGQDGAVFDGVFLHPCIDNSEFTC
jgi:hypothetical protein